MKQIKIPVFAIKKHRKYFIKSKIIESFLNKYLSKRKNGILLLKEFLLNNLDTILTGEHDKLKNIHEKIKKTIVMH